MWYNDYVLLREEIKNMSILLDNMKKKLNENQFEVATHTTGPAVVMAGAGSGKTQTLVDRVAYLHEVDPFASVLMVTFTKKAADEMHYRVLASVDMPENKFLACTFHSFCLDLLKKYGKHMGIEKLNICSPVDYTKYIKAALNDKPIYDDLRKLVKEPGVIHSLFSKSINAMLPIQMLIQSEEEFAPLYGQEDILEMLRYDVDILMLKNTPNSYFTFDDFMAKALELLKDDTMAARIAMSHKYIMVDEFQDTNNLQEAILLRLAKYNTNIVVVGDVSQAIYQFRAANVENIVEFPNKLPDCKRFALVYNYRSDEPIIRFANETMKYSIYEYHDMKLGKRYNPERDCYESRDGQQLPEFHVYANTDAEDEAVISEMMRLHDDMGVPYSHMAVLSRTSAYTSGIETKLSHYGIDYDKRGGKKFLETRGVVAVLNYFQLMLNPFLFPAITNITSLEYKVGDKTATAIAKDVCLNHSYGFTDCCKKKGLQKLQKASLESLCSFMKSLDDKDFHTQFQMIANYYVMTVANTIKLSTSKDKTDDYKALEADKKYIQRLDEISRKYDDALTFVTDMITNANAEDDDRDDNDVAVVSTIHSAKGLQWEYVFLVGCYEGNIPYGVQFADYGTELDQESLNVWYVAITRAERGLIMSMPHTVGVRNKDGFVMYLKQEPTHYVMHPNIWNSNVLNIVQH
jgi:DNA helicase-2/ATP-dependent DNA helicase PcrA